jgi:ribose 1,5-bisphosphokinase PhnN
VDNAVNEQAAVRDVALIDYDGRQATLRVWVTGRENPESVRQALYQSLRSRLGDEDVADIDIEFEERAAA